jgi:hypothetical protein
MFSTWAKASRRRIPVTFQPLSSFWWRRRLWIELASRRPKIWRDNWFCREPSLRPLGKKNLSRLKWVSELLDQRTCSWDMDLIKHIFYPIDADIIAKMKKPQGSVDDYVAWHYEKSGIYIIA